MLFEEFLKQLQPILNKYHCSFGYQRKNCKKHGHLKQKKELKTKKIEYEIKIEKNDNDAAKIYTLIHEFTHLYNYHLVDTKLTYAQKEYVADFVAKEVIKFLKLEQDLLNSNLASKWDIELYGANWLQKSKVNVKKKQEMQRQCIKTLKILKILTY